MEILTKFKAQLRGKSVRDFLELMSGTVISQLLPILFFPILSRLYTPADYGVLGLFMGISMILISLSALQLNMAVTLPKEEDEALSIIAAGILCVKIVSLTSIVLITISILIPFCHQWLISVNLQHWIFAAPVVVFFSGSTAQLTPWFIRKGNFSVVTKSRVTTAVITVSLSLLFTLFWRNEKGLIISYLAASILGWLQLQFYFRKDRRLPGMPLKKFKTYLVKYKSFALYTTPTEFISNFAQQLPLYILSVYAGAQSVGWFSRCRQILGIPITYISASIAEVYRQKASELHHSNQRALLALYNKTLISLALVGIFPFIVLILSGPVLFEIAFGAPWKQAGVYAQYLGVMYFLRFVFSPLAFNFYLKGKQKIDLILQIVFMGLSSIFLWIGFAYFSEDAGIIFFSLSFSMMYLLYGYLSKRILKEK